MSRLLIFNDLLTFVNADIIDGNEEQPLKISFFLCLFFPCLSKQDLKKLQNWLPPKQDSPQITIAPKNLKS